MLSNTQVKKIRYKMLFKENINMSKLADKLGISKSSISIALSQKRDLPEVELALIQWEKDTKEIVSE